MGEERFRALGFDAVVPTYHNVWGQARDIRGADGEPMDVWGMEWSAGTPYESPLHILVYNRSPQPADLGAEKDWRRMIARAKSAGAVLIVAHFWRWDPAGMPSAAQLIAAGVDGFEIEGRSQELSHEARDRQFAIADAIAEASLSGFANSDFHGRRAFNYQWNSVAWPESLDASEALWGALQGAPVRSLVLQRREAPAWAEGVLLPPWFAQRYLREMGKRQRVGWVLLFGAIALSMLVASLWRRR